MKLFAFLLCLHCTVANLNTSWWKNTIIYEVFIWSYKDSDGDGIGDIKGITTKVDHFVDLGIETIYVSPFFKSPMQDQGYDVSDYTQIDPIFGTMADFDELVRELKKRGLKLVIDFVINHSSDKHDWFQKSIDRIFPYTDYYIWKDAKTHTSDGTPIPPNNWRSIFGGVAWEWNDVRKQFYLHQFSPNQPDLNLRNKFLKKDLYKIMKFWYDKGVAGLRFDATKHFMEDELFRDEPLWDPNTIDKENYWNYNHMYTVDLWESYKFIHRLRKYSDKYSKKKGDIERIIMAEVYTSRNNTMQYYDKKNYPITQFPFNFYFVLFLKKFENARYFNDIMHQWLDNMPEGAIPNWNIDNHDNPRVTTRLNPEYGDIMLITIMMAPGISYIYYGQEIGMINHKVRKDQQKDKNIDAATGAPRDEERLPMQWDDSINAGFTANSKPWLPVNTNYWKNNVKTQKTQENSNYNLFKTLSQLRKTTTLKHGDFQSYILSTWVFAFTRTKKGHATYIIIHNLGSETEMIDLHHNIKGLPSKLEVVASSLNSGYKKGFKIRSEPKFPRTFSLRPLSSIVLKTIKK